MAREISWITDEDCKLQDNAKLIIGDGADTNDETVGDIYLAWDGTKLAFTQAAANSGVYWGVDGAGMDQIWYGDTASAYLYWDQSNDMLYTQGAAGMTVAGNAGLLLADDIMLKFGNSADVTMDWNASGGLDVLAAADNSLITFGTGTLAFDLKIWSGATTTYTYFDADADTNNGQWSFGLDDYGVDVKLFGATASNYLLWDESADQLVSSGTAMTFSWGAKANLKNSGTTIPSTDDFGVFRVFADDNGASIAQSVRTFQARTLITVDQTGGSIRSVQGQVKYLNLADVTSGIYTAVQGYNELAGTHIAKTGSTWSCFDASTEIGTALTINSGGEYYGIHVETTGSGTITVDSGGKCAAIGITKAAGAANWPVGLYIDSDMANAGVKVGALGSNTTSGMTIGTATALNGFYADDSGAAQTASTVWRNLEARTYYSATQSNAAADAYVIRGQLKAANAVDFTGDTSVRAATNSYVELAGATTVGAGSFFASHFAEIWADGNLTATGKVAGVMSRCYTSGAATLGDYTAAFMATKQWASTDTWPVALYVDSADNVLYFPSGTNYEAGIKVTASAIGTGGGTTINAAALMRCNVGGTAYYVPMFTADLVTNE